MQLNSAYKPGLTYEASLDSLMTSDFTFRFHIGSVHGCFSPPKFSRKDSHSEVPISLLFKVERKYIHLMNTLASSHVDTWQSKFEAAASRSFALSSWLLVREHQAAFWSLASHVGSWFIDTNIECHHMSCADLCKKD